MVGSMTDVGARSMTLDRVRVLPGWAVLVVSAVTFWGVGFLPWIVEGMHLEVSSGWARFDTIRGPVVALPFGEYAFATLLVSCVIGGTAALAVSRAASPGVRHPRGLAATGAFASLLSALAHTFFTVRPGLAQTNEARLLVAALVVAILASGVFGILVGVGVAGAPGWPWLLGGAVAASFLGSWLVDLVVRNPAGAPEWLVRFIPWNAWVGGIALGGVLAVFGVRPATRLVGWFFALAIAWVVPSVLTAMVYTTAYASRGSLRGDQLQEVVDAGRDVFVQSLSPSNHPLGPLVAAVVVGAAGAAWRLNRPMPRPQAVADAG